MRSTFPRPAFDDSTTYLLPITYYAYISAITSVQVQFVPSLAPTQRRNAEQQATHQHPARCAFLVHQHLPATLLPLAESLYGYVNASQTVWMSSVSPRWASEPRCARAAQAAARATQPLSRRNVQCEPVAVNDGKVVYDVCLCVCFVHTPAGCVNGAWAQLNRTARLELHEGCVNPLLFSKKSREWPAPRPNRFIAYRGELRN